MSTTTTTASPSVSRPRGEDLVAAIAAGDYRGAFEQCKGHTGYLNIGKLFSVLLDVLYGIQGYDADHPVAVRAMAERKALAAQLAKSLAYQQALPVVGFF